MLMDLHISNHLKQKSLFLECGLFFCVCVRMDVYAPPERLDRFHSYFAFIQ
jgi:hypothetical protein